MESFNLISFEKLPSEFQVEEVKKYYDVIKKKKISLVLKRMFDIIVSLIMLIFLIIPIIIISILISLDSKGGVFYRQERITTYGRKFRIFKFRTMVSDADKIGSLVTLKNDSRITKVGHFLRKYRLDEMPQIFNVLFGDMSFVGTRPEVEKYVSRYEDYMLATLLLPAGITSVASLNYKDEDEIMSKYINENQKVDDVYVKYILPDKMKYNLEYIEKFSFFYDLKIMFKTFIYVFLKRKENSDVN